MSIPIGWVMAPELYLWMGDVLVQGLSDTLSSQFGRMRCAVRPSELLGCYSGEDDASATLTRRLLLVGCSVTQNAEGDTVVQSSALSRPVLLKPCGEEMWRRLFHLAMEGACAALDPLEGLAMVSLPGVLPQPTLCSLAFSSNKQRPIVQLQPVTVVGLEERARPARPGQDAGWAAEGGGEGVEKGSSAVGGGAGASSSSSSSSSNSGGGSSGSGVSAPSSQICGKVVPALDPATGTPCAPTFLKLIDESVLTELKGGALEVSNSRTIFRVQAAFGLLAYKGQGPWATLSLRAVDLERDDDAELFLPKPASAPPTATFLSALGLGSTEAGDTVSATAQDPTGVFPVLEHQALVSSFKGLLALLAGTETANSAV